MKTALPAALSLVLCATPASAADRVAGESLAATSRCINCHDPRSGSEHAIIPILNGQNAAYLANQLLAFRAAPPASATVPVRARHDRLMDPKAAPLSDTEIADVAAYYAGLACPRPRTRPPPPTAPRQAGLCGDCHGAQGISAKPELPNLVGQKEGYLLKQLQDFRAAAVRGAPRAGEEGREHAVMVPQVAALTDAEIAALAAYYAALPCR